MITLSSDTETIAVQLARAQRVSVDEAVRGALEDRARAVGLPPALRRRRMSVEQMLSVGAEIAAMPLLDPRSPSEIMDDLNAA